MTPTAPRVRRGSPVLAAVAALTLVGPVEARTVPTVEVVNDATGARLRVDGDDFMVFGMNWDYIPIGENYSWNLWSQPDEVIEAALAREMPLLLAMGVNTIRVYAGMPPRWVEYVYETYGIYTVLNHPMARYGFTLDGTWHPVVDYSDPRMRAAIEADVLATVEKFRDTPGVLLWLLGNENNYGLSWSSFEIEALPEGERDAARARYLYSLFGRIARSIKERDPDRLVSMANGDLQYIDIIAEECGDIDVFGSNVYRGISARDFFDVVKDKLDVPVFFTEFGADAFNAREMREDQVTQAHYLVGQWEEIYEQSAGKGRAGNAVGGFIFQWSDGWWKFGQESRLEIHDTNASWPNAGYPEDWVAGENNMNEEWWGICAKGPPDDSGLFDVYPRAAYYALREAFTLDPWAPDTDLDRIRAHFRRVQPVAMELAARGDRAARVTDALEKVRVSRVFAKFETYSTGGTNIETPSTEEPAASGLPSFLGFDNLQSFFVGFEAKPAPSVVGSLELSVLGHVPENPIDEIFYENRGRPRTVDIEVDGQTETFRLNGIERVKVYRAGVTWDDSWFALDGFYRTGHAHWGYEGDFFGLYRDAYYGENIDIYNGEAPVGVEIAAKRKLTGLKIAFGPQLWWGANPAVMLKYRRQVGAFDATLVAQEDIADQSEVATSVAIPIPQNRKVSLQASTRRGPFKLEVGGLWAGSLQVDETFQVVEEDGAGSYRIFQDRIVDADTFGGKARLTYQSGRWNWYGQAGYFGLVADGFPLATQNFTGWQLVDSGSGNQTHAITGLAFSHGNLQIGPNFLWQKPVVGPIPGDVPSPGRPRNVSVSNDPFAVRGNRETVGAEIILTHDPTPGTWFYQWDNDRREDARLAWNLGYVYRHHPTTQDAATGIQEDGVTLFAFPGAPPPRDLWEVSSRIASRLGARTRLVARLFVGTGEPRGDDPRLVERYGIDARVAHRTLAIAAHAKVGDWGPYDYHRDSNLTFPLQLMGDVSKNLGSPVWFGLPQTRIGVRGTWRSLDENSPRYCPGRDDMGECDPTLPGDDGTEWEIRTYLHLSAG